MQYIRDFTLKEEFYILGNMPEQIATTFMPIR